MKYSFGHFFASFRLRMIASVIFVECIMTFLLVWDNLSTISQSQYQQLKYSADMIIHQLANTVGSYMVRVDYAQLEEYLLTVKQQHALNYVLVSNYQDKIAVSLGDPPPWESSEINGSLVQIRDHTFDLVDNIRLSNIDLGRIRIGVYTKAIEKVIENSRTRNLAIASIGILLTILVTILIGLSLTRRLTLLANSARDVGRGNYNANLNLESNDEIGNTAKAFNLMVQKIDANRQHLQTQTLRNKLILENSHDGFWIAGVEGYFHEVNRAYCEMIGYDRKELLNMNIKDVEFKENSVEISTHIQNIISKGSDRFETQHRRKDGVIIDIDASVTAIEIDQEQLIVAFIRDITERNIAARELQNHREHLEELVLERTAKLKEANEELETYSYSIAHDLRAPLRSIAGFCHALQEDTKGKLNESEHAYLDRIINAANHMAELIDDILDFARISRAAINHQTVDISTIAKRVKDRLEESEQKHPVKWQIQSDLKDIGDPILLDVALDNLLGNAYKYTSKNATAQIEFGIKEKKPEVVYYVKDNGVGFDMQYSNKLFGVFQRLHTNNEFEGTGIGLATVQRIIHQHGGRIWAAAEVDKGATFYFTLHSSNKKHAIQ